MMYWKTSFDGDNRNDKKDFNTKMKLCNNSGKTTCLQTKAGK